ncbi:hypothetical protein HNR02_003397 [Amycolatopsis endophytica]|uniref:DUF3040 family protein n=1 Tax=Amycolatopsis endophytica TaxID=860233 RepID=A0A853B5M7_9PSEU|nr:hypothetical protein [Amycolatopsis endophytica]NYI90074.1 hypothetical protein [Amycolatopsis endophytica]
MLDEQFYSTAEQAIVDSPALPSRDARRLDGTSEGWARLWRVVLLGMTTVSALAMIVFALMKAIPSTALCMLALIVVKTADHWNSRRLTGA